VASSRLPNNRLEGNPVKIIGGIAALGVVTLLCGTALAADPPDLVGTWKSVPGTFASVRYGDGNPHHPDYDKPSYGAEGEVWSIVVEEQQGRAFAGKAMSPKGGAEQIVGVVSFDGQRLTIAASEGGLLGTISGNQIEFCYQDQEDGRAGVACYVAEKE
jgi:hypothetical protein